MWVKGSDIPQGRGWQVLSKGSSPAGAGNTTAVAAGTKLTVASLGIPITLLPRQAIRVRRYLSSIVQVAPDNTCFVIGGEMGYAVSPFALASMLVLYPVMHEIAVPLAAAITNAPIGQQLLDVGVNGTLIDDWLEFDDVATDQYLSSFQIKSFWTVFNTSAAGKSVTVLERATWEIYEQGRLSALSSPATKVVIVNQGSLKGDP